jgi:dihydrolipoamide dehydrogenase
MSTKFDLVIIGAGPAGYVAAIRAGQLGMSVACIEKRPRLGGTCLNVGCIPSKTLLQSSEYFEVLSSKGDEHGITCSGLKANLSKMMERKEGVLNTLGQGIDGLFKKNKVKRFEGNAKLIDSNTISIEGKDKTTIKADKIILAMGSEPIELPFLPFDEKVVLSSTGALSLDKIPKEMTVIGAGVIGLELATVYRRLGTKIRVIELLDHICPALDKGVGKVLQQSLKKQGLEFHLGTKVQKAKIDKKHVELTIEKDGKESVIKSDTVLVGIGRRPRSEKCGLEEIGVNLDSRGFVLVNDGFQTSIDNIYAVGDLIDGPMLAHKASEEAVALVESFNGTDSHINYLAIPSVIYTQPEVASVGLTEEEAKEMGLGIKIGKYSFKGNSRAKCTGHDEGLVKILAEEKTLKIIGMHIVNAHASEMIGEGVIAIEKQANVHDIAHACHAHPTYSEAIKEAALSVTGKPIHG